MVQGGSSTKTLEHKKRMSPKSTYAAAVRNTIKRTMRLKFHHKGEIRVVVIDREEGMTSFKALKQRLRNDYGFELRLEYEDAENDHITIASQNDLNEVIALSPDTTINIHVIPLDVISTHTDSAPIKKISTILSAPTPTASAACGSLESLDLTRSTPRIDLKQEKAKTPPHLAVSETKKHSLHNQEESTQNKERPIRWQRGQMIGRGAFGRVYMALNLDTGELMAMKEVDSISVSSRERLALENEIAMMKGLQHPNIVRYLGLDSSAHDLLAVFLEFVPGGSLRTLLDRFGRLEEAVVRLYSRQILLGLEYLHSNGIAHRDIKAANVLVSNDGSVKLADFGASKRISGGVFLVVGLKSTPSPHNTQERHKEYSSTKEQQQQQPSGFPKGTPLWMAPEVIKEQPRAAGWRKADVWSLGCTVIEMATGRPPWSQLSNPVTAMYHIACSEQVPDMPTELSSDAHDFLRLCFQRDPKQRPEISVLLFQTFAAVAPSAWRESQRANNNPLSSNGELYPSRPSTTQGSRDHGLGARCGTSHLRVVTTGLVASSSLPSVSDSTTQRGDTPATTTTATPRFFTSQQKESTPVASTPASLNQGSSRRSPAATTLVSLQRLPNTPSQQQSETISHPRHRQQSGPLPSPRLVATIDAKHRRSSPKTDTSTPTTENNEILPLAEGEHATKQQIGTCSAKLIDRKRLNRKSKQRRTDELPTPPATARYERTRHNAKPRAFFTTKQRPVTCGSREHTPSGQGGNLQKIPPLESNDPRRDKRRWRNSARFPTTQKIESAREEDGVLKSNNQDEDSRHGDDGCVNDEEETPEVEHETPRNNLLESSLCHQHNAPLTCLGAGGSVLAAGAHDGAVFVVNCAKPTTTVSYIDRPFESQTTSTSSGKKYSLRNASRKNEVSALTLDKCGQCLIASRDTMCYVWATEENKLLHRLEGHEAPLTCLSLLDEDNGARIHTSKLQNGVSSSGPWSGCILSGSMDHSVRLWDVRMRKPQALALRGHTDTVNAVQLHSDTWSIWTASNDTCIRVWDMRSGRCRFHLTQHFGSVKCLVYDASLDGDRGGFLSGARDTSVHLWAADTAACMRALRTQRGFVHDIALSPRLKQQAPLAACASTNGRIRIWDHHRGRCLRTLSGHTHAVNCLAWSGDATLDDTLLVSASTDATVRLWRPKTGAPFRTIKSHKSPVIALHLTDYIDDTSHNNNDEHQPQQKNNLSIFSASSDGSLRFVSLDATSS